MGKTFLIHYQMPAQWLTLLWQALPVKLRPTLLESLVGKHDIRGAGHVTDAILAVLGKTNWTNYFKALQSNGYSWLKLSYKWLELVLLYLPRLNITLIIDDVLTPMASKKAPPAALYQNHTNTPNRPTFIFGQMRVALAMVLTYGGRVTSFP